MHLYLREQLDVSINQFPVKTNMTDEMLQGFFKSKALAVSEHVAVPRPVSIDNAFQMRCHEVPDRLDCVYGCR